MRAHALYKDQNVGASWLRSWACRLQQYTYKSYENYPVRYILQYNKNQYTQYTYLIINNSYNM